MKHKFLTIEDTFLVTGRGLIVVPGPLENEYSGPTELNVELKKPNGSVSSAVLLLQHFFQTPPPKEYRWGCVLKGVSKEEVPVGTEVWVEHVA